jgi:pimeloyl-ACP methyl ester carboxylesterase
VEIIRVSGARIAVRKWGPEDAPPFIFWHALGPAASGATISEVAPALVSRGWRLLSVDGPGFGASDVLTADRYEVPALVSLLFDLLDELGVERAVLAGHSWGGTIAVEAAAARPLRAEALVLLDSGHVNYGDLDDVDPDRPIEAWVADARERPARWPNRSAFEKDLRAVTRRWSPELLESFLPGVHAEGTELVGASPEARGAALRGAARARPSEAWPALARAAIPVLLLLAGDEPWRSQSEAALPAFEAALPQAEIRWLEDCSHAVLADRGPPLGNEIADWLEAHT